MMRNWASVHPIKTWIGTGILIGAGIVILKRTGFRIRISTGIGIWTGIGIGIWTGIGIWIWNPNGSGLWIGAGFLIATGILRWLLSSRGRATPELRYTVEYYGQGNVHDDIVKRIGIPKCGEDPGIPCVLFVYKVSRDTEDLRNALRWIQRDRMIKREDICAVVLLEKTSNQDDKPVEVNHGGVFDDQTAVVRILWKGTSLQQWFPPFWKYCDKVQEGPRYWEAMDKVTESIKKRQRE